MLQLPAALLLAAQLALAPAQFTVLMPATGVAARTDRRPVAGGVYDARAHATFITWGGQFEDNYIQSYDHATGAWSTPVRVGGGDSDSHNYPTIVQADDGHLLVFRSLHNTELRVARSERPHAIDGTWTDTVIPEGLGATYPMPVKTPNSSIYVFIRETAHDFDPSWPTDTRPMKYVRSTDDGKTWQSSASLTGDRWAIAPTTRTDNMNEIYVGQLRYAAGRIQFVYTLAGGGPEGHLHDRYHKNIYYVTFSPSDLHFRSAAGHDLGTSIDDAEQEQFLKVAETALQTTNPRSPDYISLVGTSLGKPFVVWMGLDTAGVLHTHAAAYRAGRWTTVDAPDGVRVRDMEPVSGDTWRVYATAESGATGIATYKVKPGRSWTAETTIPTPKAVQRIEVVTGGRDPVRILATGASSDRDVAIADGDIYVAGLRCP